MSEISLGQRLHEFRELARNVGIPSPCLSDIKLGRRFPPAKLAEALNVSFEDLKQYDNREPIADLKRLMGSDPKLELAPAVTQVLQIA